MHTPTALAAPLLAACSLLVGSAALAQDFAWDFMASEDQILNCVEPAPYPAGFGCAVDGSTDSVGTATAHFEYDVETQMLSFEVSWDGLEGDLVSMHVHGPATPQMNNLTHIFDIFAAEIDVVNAGVDRRSDTYAGMVFIDRESMEITDLINGDAYLNLHTLAFAHGELRGNLGAAVTTPDYVWSFTSSEDQILNCIEPAPYPAGFGCAMDGSTDSVGTATARFEYDETTELLSFEVSWNGLEGDLVSMHVHGPATPQMNNLTHIFDIFAAEIDVVNAGVDRRSDTYTGMVFIDEDSMDIDELVGGNAYLNLHTLAFAHGEIRGNLGEAARDLLWNFSASEDQILNCTEPAPYPAGFGCAMDASTDSVGTATARFEYDVATEVLSYEVDWDGLEGDLVSMHVHGPATPQMNNLTHIFDVFSSEIDVVNSGVDRRSDNYSGDVMIAAASDDYDTLAAGDAYLNLHTLAFVHGEIRGNLPEPGSVLGGGMALAALAAFSLRERAGARGRRGPRAR